VSLPEWKRRTREREAAEASREEADAAMSAVEEIVSAEDLTAFWKLLDRRLFAVVDQVVAEIRRELEAQYETRIVALERQVCELQERR
jgi:hypothetical protein